MKIFKSEKASLTKKRYYEFKTIAISLDLWIIYICIDIPYWLHTESRDEYERKEKEAFEEMILAFKDKKFSDVIEPLRPTVDPSRPPIEQ